MISHMPCSALCRSACRTSGLAITTWSLRRRGLHLETQQVTPGRQVDEPILLHQIALLFIDQRGKRHADARAPSGDTTARCVSRPSSFRTGCMSFASRARASCLDILPVRVAQRLTQGVHSGLNLLRLAKIDPYRLALVRAARRRHSAARASKPLLKTEQRVKPHKFHECCLGWEGCLHGMQSSRAATGRGTRHCGGSGRLPAVVHLLLQAADSGAVVPHIGV